MDKLKNEIPVVEIADLYKSYWRGNQRIPVLEDITLTIPEGEFIALMGPSGSGKTTLLNLIAGIDQADQGTIKVAGTDITRLGETELAAWRSRHIGFVFQFYNLLPVLTAYENVELPLLLSDLTRKARRLHVETALRVVGLADRLDHYPRQLSGGQQQRVAIARAIITDPTIVVADEPTGDLDKVSAQGDPAIDGGAQPGVRKDHHHGHPRSPGRQSGPAPVFFG